MFVNRGSVDRTDPSDPSDDRSVRSGRSPRLAQTPGDADTQEGIRGFIGDADAGKGVELHVVRQQEGDARVEGMGVFAVATGGEIAEKFEEGAPAIADRHARLAV